MITTLIDRFRLWCLRQRFERFYYFPALRATKDEQWRWFCEFEELGEVEFRRRLENGTLRE